MNEFDKILQDQLKDGEQQTPAFIWDNIEQAIDPPKRPKWLIFWISLLGLLLVLGLSTLIYFQSASIEQVVLNQQQASGNTFSGNQHSIKPSPSPQEKTEEETSSIIRQTAISSDTLVSKPPVHLIKPQLKQEDIFAKRPKVAQNALIRSQQQRNQSNFEELKEFAQTGIHPKIAGILSPALSTDELNPASALSFRDSAQVAHSVLASSFSLYRLQRNDYLLLTSPLNPKDSSIKAVSVPESAPLKETSKFFIEAKIGYSAYQMSLWDEFFLVGALSGRPFPAKGYNINLETGYSFKRWLNPILGFNLNHKSASFTYDALYDDQGYFDYDIRGNAICIHDINNGDYLCNKYLLEDIEADFSIRSYSLTLGNRFNLLNSQRIGMDLDLKYSLDLRSSVSLNSITKIDVSDYLSQSYNSRAAAGLNLNFKLNERTRLFIYPEYIFMPAKDEHELYKGPLQELITSFGIRINL